MTKCVMYTSNGDYYLDRILSVIEDKDLVEKLMDDYYKLCETYLTVEPFKMDFEIGVPYRDQLREYLSGDTWKRFKTVKYVRLQILLNIKDETMYDLVRNRNELDFWELDNVPQ